jgi:hypothetical protein
MPVVVRYKPVKGDKDYAIVEKATGRIKGRSSSKEKAQSSANARNAVKYGDWKPGKRR